MDDELLRRIVGVVTLMLVALLLSWWLPTPGLQQLQAPGERHVTIDLTQADPKPQEWTVVRPRSPSEPGPAPTAGDSGSERMPATAPAPDEDVAVPDGDGDGDGDPAPSPLADGTQAAEQGRKAEPAASPPVEPVRVAEPSPPAPVRPDPPAVATPTPQQPIPPASKGSVQIQAGAFSHLDHARSIVDRAKALGVDCRISPVDAAKGTLYRVRCGPFAGTAAAEKAIATLGARGITSLIVRGG